MSARLAHLRFEHVSKAFGVVQALDDVSFEAHAGSVHALLGENGAGKSTLLKILSGAHAATRGVVLIGGQPFELSSPAAGLAAGVAVIYQELHLVPELTVEENLLLGHLPARWGVVDRRRLRALAREQLARLSTDVNPGARLGSLPIGQRQMVEIAKALSHGAKVIAFDEPTSSLSAREVEALFAVIRSLRQEGCVILYVSHRLEEVFAVCDAATVLRDGRHVCTWNELSGATMDDIVRAMVGRDIRDIYGYAPRELGATALDLDGIVGPGLREPLSLQVRQGEVVGLFGLVGAGRTELLRLIAGATRRSAGSIRVLGQRVECRSPREAIRAGIVLCPEDRKRDGIIGVRSVLENINISARRNTARAGLFVNETWERQNAREKVRQLAVRTPSLRQLVSRLSGGNQQKVILARWLSERVRVLLLDEPTRGIDVGAKSEVYALMYELAQRGLGILMVSSELPEVLGASDRVLVMCQGRLTGELPRTEANEVSAVRLALPQLA